MKLLDYEHFAVQRRRDGKSQQDVARELGVTQGYIAQVENGIRGLNEDMKKLYPKKLSSVKRHEAFRVLLRRAGIKHGEAKKLLNVVARDFNDWIRGDQRVPDNAFTWVRDKAAKIE
jgi:predicted transcriptional regulator